MATPITGSFAAAGQSSTFWADAKVGINVTIEGTFVASIRLERQLKSGNWLPLTISGNAWAVYTAPVSEQAWEESATGIAFRLNCTSYTSGTATYVISQ